MAATRQGPPPPRIVRGKPRPDGAGRFHFGFGALGFEWICGSELNRGPIPENESLLPCLDVASCLCVTASVDVIDEPKQDGFERVGGRPTKSEEMHFRASVTGKPDRRCHRFDCVAITIPKMSHSDKHFVLFHLLKLAEVCGPLPQDDEARVHELPSAALDKLAKALLRFQSLDDLHAWLDRHVESPGKF